jgi:hypothetical protein
MNTAEHASYDGPFDLANSQATAAWYREVDTVIDENRMDLVGHGRDKIAKELGGNPGGCFLMQLDKGEFDVRSLATKKWSLPSLVRTSAMSMWKKPIG